MMLDDLDHYRLIRLEEVLRLTGMSKSQWFRLKARGETPTAWRLGPRTVRYRLGDVVSWIQSLPPASGEPGQ